MPILAKLLSSWLGPDEAAKPPTQAPSTQAPAPAPAPAPALPKSPLPTTHQQSALQRLPSEPHPHRAPDDNFGRSAKQLGLFCAGAGFVALSALITRRAVTRKMKDSTPRLFQPSHHGPNPPPRAPDEKGQDHAIAAEALGLATLNVVSFGIMMTGGLMWGFDISSFEDLRTKARASLYGANGVVDEAAEQEIEEWIADVLSRKDKKEDVAGAPPKKKDA